MAERNPKDTGEWRLGIEPGEHHRPETQPVALILSDPSTERLERPLYQLTAEHLGWAAVALYTILTRLAALGMRPLSTRGARAALFASEIWRDGLAPLGDRPFTGAAWPHLLEALFFGAFGASDYSARLIGGLFGIALVAAAFAMRRSLGRAGALGFATLLALSPTVTYVSRADSWVIPAAALIVWAIAAVFAPPRGRADVLRFVGAGCLIAFALSASPVAYAAALIFIAMLPILGVWHLAFTRNPWISFRVWWERRAALMVFAAVILVGVFYALETAFGRRGIIASATVDWLRLWPIGIAPDAHAAFQFYLPSLIFYEFLIAIAAALALVAVAALRVRFTLAGVALLWTVGSAAFYLFDPARHNEWLVMVLVPAAMLAGAGIDWLHHTIAWTLVRYLVGALAILTVYTQVMVNFVHYAPDPTEAEWHRHMTLYFSEPATTTLAPEEFRHAENSIPRDARVFIEGDEPIAEWYFRDLARADNPGAAQLIVSPATQETATDGGKETREFAIEEKWNPRLEGLSAGQGIKYFFTQRAWSAIYGRDIRLKVPTPIAIVIPPTTSAAAESPAATPTTTPSPTATATASAQPTPSETPTASPSTVPTSTIAESPTPAPAQSPAPAPAATP